MPFKLNPFTGDFDYYSITSALHASSHEVGGADLVDHDNLTGFVANEHIDWTADQGAVNIHVGNYTDSDTTDHTALSNIGTKTHAQIDTHLDGDGSDHADVASNTTNIGTNTTAIGLNTTHKGSDGSDHSKVTANETAIALNTTHRSSDGSDHSKVGANETAIAINTTHRGSDGSDHSKVGANETAIALNTTHRGSDGTDHANVMLNDTHRGATGNVHGHDTHDHSTALGTAIAADLSDITSPGARIELATNHTGDMALQNMLMNGGFEETDGTNAYYWQTGTGIVTETTGGDNSNKYLKLTRSGSNKFCRQYTISGATRYFEVNEGEVYEFGGSIKSDTTCMAIIYTYAYDKDLGYVTAVNANSISATWEVKSNTYVIPSGVKFLLFHCVAITNDGWAAFDNVYLKRIDEKAWSFTHASDRNKIDEAKIYQREYFPNMKSGVDQATAGAAAGELWQDTNDDNTVKMGV